MNNRINIIGFFFAIIFILAFAACNSYDFEQEQYRNEVNLLSNSSLIYDRQVANISNAGDTIYLVAGMSGTNSSAAPLNVKIMNADSLFHAYNRSNYDIDTERFAKWLPEACYTLTETSMQIKPGDFQAKLPIVVKNLELISPDSTYFLNYQIDPSGTSAFNPQKKEVLLRIYKSNEFATTKTNTFYNYTTSFITTMIEGGAVRRPTSSNQVFPIGENSVRMMAGDESLGDYNTALDRINKRSIKVTIGNQTPYDPSAREVKIETYKGVDVVQMAPKGIYDNTYLINAISTPDGRSTYFKEFRLHYKYRLNPTDPYREVEAIMRMEYNPRAELL